MVIFTVMRCVHSGAKVGAARGRRHTGMVALRMVNSAGLLPRPH